jgi:lipoprotein-anchoring transpeptidase ErfK/SrfK
MRRLGVLALGLLTVLSAACTSGAPSASQPPATSVPTFAVPGPDPVAAALKASVQGGVVVHPNRGPFRVFHTPSRGNGAAYRAVNDWGQPLWLPVIAERDVRGDLWLHVLLPERPNGSTGWLRAARVDTSVVRDRIIVRLRTHTLTRYHEGRRIARYRVAIGRPSTPTTPGRFFVWARVGYADVQGPYGNFAVGLSGFSEVITDWPGGGRMAIHGTSDPSAAGEDVSNGCIRVFNPLMATLIDVPMGATVIIRP